MRPRQGGTSIPVFGAGIAGLTTALAMSRKGWRVEIYERSQVLTEAGAGIQLSPNAIRVLDRLGLSASLRGVGCHAAAVTLRSWRSGRTLASVPVTASDGTGYLSVHRADLQSALLSALAEEPSVTIRLGARLDALSIDGGRVDAVVRCADGETRRIERQPLAVAADGVRSAAAASLGLPPPVDSGKTAWRLTCRPSFRQIDGIEAWLGPERHAVAYPVRKGREINVVLILPTRECEDAVQRHGPSALDRLFQRWHSSLTDLIAAGEIQGSWPLMTVGDHRPLVRQGCLAFVGDSAHAMLPFAAQGAAMAIEDGYVLTDALSRREPADALASYEAQRRGRIERVRGRVRFHDWVYHLPSPLALGRNLVMRTRSPRALQHDLDWLYGWKPPVDG